MGDAVAGNADFRGATNMTIAERFWPKVDRSGDGCWEWRASTCGGGYGHFRIGFGGGIVLSHRVAYVLAKGTIPVGLDVLHTCDNKPCCNPDHLYVGTDLDNARDRRERGPDNRPRGECRYMCKISDADVVAIRGSDAPDGELAERYGISPSYVHNLKAGYFRKSAGVR